MSAKIETATRGSKRRHLAGFTLVEIMVVVAIIGILAGLSVVAYTQVGSASAPRNAINDLTTALGSARTLATENQADVWVIFYPTFNKKAPASLGPGAYFIHQDKAGTFNRTSAVTSTEVYYRTGTGGVNFDPALNTLAGSTSVEGQLIDQVYLDDYPGSNVIFALPNGGGSLTLGAAHAPFAGLVVGSACTFCDGSPARGAIIFGADGSARFVNSSGGIVSATGAAAVNRAQAVAIKDRPTPTTETRAYVVAVSGPTAFIGNYSVR